MKTSKNGGGVDSEGDDADGLARRALMTRIVICDYLIVGCTRIKI